MTEQVKIIVQRIVLAGVDIQDVVTGYEEYITSQRVYAEELQKIRDEEAQNRFVPAIQTPEIAIEYIPQTSQELAQEMAKAVEEQIEEVTEKVEETTVNQSIESTDQLIESQPTRTVDELEALTKQEISDLIVEIKPDFEVSISNITKADLIAEYQLLTEIK